MEIEVVVEIPKGSRNKYEMDHATGVIRLDRMLFTATQYPADYGFVPDTLAEDGDPLDALVLLEESTFPGCHITVRPLGVFWMSDEKGADAKLLTVVVRDPRWERVDDIEGLPEHLLDEISHFFEVYKALEPGKGTHVGGWEGRASAEAAVEDARRRHREGSAGQHRH
jgi:inorganic pyrophosphatase